MIAFVVRSKPIAQPRPRAGVKFTKRGKPVARIYRDEEHAIHAFRDDVQVAARAAYQGPPMNLPLSMSVTFVMPRPERLCRKKDDPGRIWCPTRPDSSNLLKGVEDAINGIIYEDDAQIVRHVLTRFYAARDEQPCVEVEIEVMG